MYGQTEDPSAGRKEMDAKFGEGVSAAFQMGYLTKQSALWAVLGLNLGSSFSPGGAVGSLQSSELHGLSCGTVQAAASCQVDSDSALTKQQALLGHVSTPLALLILNAQ